MFSLKNFGRTGRNDFSLELRDKEDWVVGTLKTLEYHLDITAFAIDPVSSLLAIGCAAGTVRILGSPAVESILKLPDTSSVRFIQFATNLLKLICIDDNNKLYLWDLTSIGNIKLEATTSFKSPVNCIALSPSHTHVYIGLDSGEIKTYDLLCRRQSSYTIPNAWELYEKKMLASGIVGDLDAASRIPVDVVIHPRNLNLLFIAYAGGVILTDLKERNTLRAYELVLPPGAPGGGGYTSPDLLTHRRLTVTSLAIHPAGHFFVVGHIDGSFAFWAVEDEDQPLLVRTLDDLDVHVVDGHKLEEILPKDHRPVMDDQQRSPREPIFKLSWSGSPNTSDPRGGETSLIVLGGQFSGDPSGINVLWLPRFNPPEAPASSVATTGLHPFFRKAIRESIDPLDAYFYATSGITQDFLLIPRDSPHFSGAWDPVAILLLSEGEKQTRTIEAYEYPPPGFLDTAEESGGSSRAIQSENPEDALDTNLAATLQSMQISHEPHKLTLPTTLWTGSDGLIDGALVLLDRMAYDQLIENGTELYHRELRLEGGVAVPAESVQSNIKLAKYEPHRILVTRHNDLSIRFLDVSVQLQISNGNAPLTSSFPNPLPALTINLLAALASPTITSQIPPNLVIRARLEDVRFTNEALEVAAILISGEVIVYRLRDVVDGDVIHRKLTDEQLVLLEHIPVEKGLRYKPFFMMNSRVQTSACAMSDIGFLAVAYIDGSLSIVDMRGPNIVYHIPSEQQRKSKRHSLVPLHKAPEADSITALSWTICSLQLDDIPRLRLIAVRASGLTNTFTLARSQSGPWVVSAVPHETETLANTLPMGIFVLDAHTGASCRADRNRLAISLERQSGNMGMGAGQKHDEGEEGPRCFLIVAGEKGVRSFADLGEERVARAEWGSKVGLVNAVQIVERNGSYALVAFTDRHDALVYSLPALELMHTIPLPTTSPLSLSADASGDFFTLTPLALHSAPIRRAHLHTLFDVRRGYHTPLVALTERADGTTGTVPPQPQPVSIGPAGLLSTASSWFGGLVGQGSISGDQIDALLAGPDRPIPQKAAAPAAGKSKYADWESGNLAGSTAAEASRTQSSLYDRLHAAVAERGEMLQGLEESFNSLEQGSKSMVAQAKRLAAQQTAKSWFAFG